MKWIKFFLTPSVFIALTMVMACKFEFEESVVTPNQKSVLAIETQFFLGEQPLVIVTRTRNLGELVKWDFNYKDIIEKTPDTTIYNFGQFLYDTVKNVTVQLYEGDSLIRRFKQDDPYLKISYLADRVDYKKNVEYTLKVFAPGFDTVIGKQKPPSEVKLTKAEFIPNKIPAKGNAVSLGELNMEFDDIPNEENFYHVDAYLQAGPSNKRYSLYLTPVKVDGNATSNRFLNDKTFDGKKYTWRLGLPLGYAPPLQVDSANLVIYFRSTSKDYDLYQRSLEINSIAQQSDFAEPTSSYTNLKGGIGVFAISSFTFPYVIKLYK